MASFSISEVEELTGIKAHVLRYWEDVVPSFKPQKDDGGRRFYTQREVDLIFRLKYLIYEKKFTAEGAGQQIMEEAGVAQDNFELIKLIHQTRADISNLYLKVKNKRKDSTNGNEDEN
ncbi:MAG: MerR family transcriptional regulator [Treponema bryantii]|jgi:DNA-binding transcriptional MerR regulator|nr:MerR family transcriptional regulator [Treponema bryantii]